MAVEFLTFLNQASSLVGTSLAFYTLHHNTWNGNVQYNASMCNEKQNQNFYKNTELYHEILLVKKKKIKEESLIYLNFKIIEGLH